jgi:hypothetical protein
MPPPAQQESFMKKYGVDYNHLEKERAYAE